MLIIGGQRIEFEDGTNFLDNPALGLAPGDHRQRQPHSWIRGICLHTRFARPAVLQTGAGPARDWDKLIAGQWANDGRCASSHIAIDADGSYACLADLRDTTTFHAGHVNEISIGIEIYMEYETWRVWEASIETALRLCDALTLLFGIQRQFPRESGITKRLARPEAPSVSSPTTKPGGRSGQDFVGVYGHQHVNRWKAYDPGLVMFEALENAGYEGFLIDQDADLDEWADRQKAVGIPEDERDGVAGPRTVGAVKAWQNEQGKACGIGTGLWRSRPIDHAENLRAARS